MSQEKNNEDIRSPENIQLAQDIRIIMTVPAQLEKVAITPTTKEWINFIRDYLPPKKHFPDDKGIKQLMDEIALLRDIKQNFPENFECCYTIIPCTPNGDEWSTQDLMQNAHIVRLLIPPENRAGIPEHQRQQKWLYQFTPEDIKRECGFRIKHYNNGKTLSPERLKIRMLTQTARALLNLQKLLKK
jgi:hypothetical protein